MGPKTFPCRDCGKHVAWNTSKAGKRYLSEPFEWVGGDYTLYSKWIYPGHRCEPNPNWKEQRAAAVFLEASMAQKAGAIREGVIVDVVKGRKVKVGTRAEVFWIGDTGYGPRVGLMIDGEKVYTALTNVKAAPIEELPEMLKVCQEEYARRRAEVEEMDREICYTLAHSDK